MFFIDPIYHIYIHSLSFESCQLPHALLLLVYLLLSLHYASNRDVLPHRAPVVPVQAVVLVNWELAEKEFVI